MPVPFDSLSASTGEGQGEVSNSARCFGGHSSSEIQNRHIRSRLFLAPAQRLQKLHDASASPRLVAEQTRRQRRARQLACTPITAIRVSNRFA